MQAAGEEGYLESDVNSIPSEAPPAVQLNQVEFRDELVFHGTIDCPKADFNGDGSVDAADLAVWQANYAQPTPAS